VAFWYSPQARLLTQFRTFVTMDHEIFPSMELRKVSSPTLHSPGDEPQGSPPQASGDPLSMLAQLCARTRHSGSEASRVRALADSQPDWAVLLGAAVSHGVASLVCKRLPELAGDALPAYWRDRFSQVFINHVHRNLLLTGELIRVLRALERSGAPAVPFKGPVLAQQAYGDLALRHFSDLDIVLPHSHMAAAHRAMESLGYHSEGAWAAVAEGRIPGQYAYRNDSRTSLIELHTEKTMRYLPVPLDWNALTARLETVSVGGQPLRTFSAEDTLLLLCVHGTKHFWTRLGWICDIAELVQAPRGIHWQRAESLARNMRCHRMWLLGLALANRILDAPLPEAVAHQIRTDAHVAALARRVLEQYLHGGESSVSAGARLRFRVNSQDTLATGLRQVTIFATRPTDEDWQSCSLPAWAASLYTALRPLRLLRDYSLGSRRLR
jgi:Uncharacterised nucleotidyltransferase